MIQHASVFDGHWTTSTSALAQCARWIQLAEGGTQWHIVELVHENFTDCAYVNLWCMEENSVVMIILLCHVYDTWLVEIMMVMIMAMKMVDDHNQQKWFREIVHRRFFSSGQSVRYHMGIWGSSCLTRVATPTLTETVVLVTAAVA